MVLKDHIYNKLVWRLILIAYDCIISQTRGQEMDKLAFYFNSSQFTFWLWLLTFPLKKKKWM